MEMALYYPEEGYYTSNQKRVGKEGDFYTSPYLTSVFGKLIAKQLLQMWEHLDKEAFSIVEIGAGEGLLCNDILASLDEFACLKNRLSYHIVEKSAAMREKQKLLLGDRVSWYESVHALPAVTGCFFSNEVVDNFAVHQVVMEEQLKEVFVDYDEDFVEVLLPAREELQSYFSELKVCLPPGFRTEINLHAVSWIREIAEKLKKGFVMTIDYGFPSIELYEEKRRMGTIVCYHKHHINLCPYQNVGEQDITTHINFSALQHWGHQNGLQYCGYTNQAYFLLGLGLTHHLNQMERRIDGKDCNHKPDPVFLHTFLRDMGRKMKVLIQQKGLPQVPLSGLQFSQRLG
jgi:SAM-dependent MidA family methyltransferase